jgi:hypothetical protein
MNLANPGKETMILFCMKIAERAVLGDKEASHD